MKFSIGVFAAAVLMMIVYRGVDLYEMPVCSIKEEMAIVSPGGVGPGAPETTRVVEKIGHTVDRTLPREPAGVSYPAAEEYMSPSYSGSEIGELMRPFMIVGISLILLSSCLYIILSRKFDEGSRRWAFATIGTIIGFWLKP